MDLIEWNDKYCTGIAGVDKEHKELIGSINNLYSKLNQYFHKDELINILNDIYATIHAHFMLEERLMVKYGYDEYEEHKNDHARLLDELRDMTTDLDSPSDFNEHRLQKQLNDWFMIHFKTFDSRLHKLEQLISLHKHGRGGLVAGFKKLKKWIFN